MTTVLVANRGEIAIRVFGTASRMGLRTVAVFTEIDASSPHRRAADDAVAIASYLDRDEIVAAAVRTGATLVHPGYGFLAEDDRFARACADAGLAFVGPPADVLRLVGDKASSRTLALDAGVPVFAGYGGDDQDDTTLASEAARIGFPLIVKPSGGGGGKGMAVVSGPDELADALATARRVGRAAFDDDRVVLERYATSPRHVEVQVFGDADGTVIHLGERDCSLQRRHQKILEESPSCVDASALCDAAVAFASRAGYIGAGTCEFLVAADGTAGFIEMNARLQVEHPVTEMVTGLDLVEMQLRVAQGERVGIAQTDVVRSGHAIEVRVYAEDPRSDFVPQAGRVEHVRWPDGVRVDTWIEPGVSVSTDYDPMLAKVIVHAGDRTAALDALDHALASTEILGPRTNVGFLRRVVADPVVRAGEVTTDWLEHADPASFSPGVPDAAFGIAAGAEAASMPRSDDPFASLGTFGRSSRIVVRFGDDERFVAPGPAGSAVRAGEGWLVWAGGDQWEMNIGPAPRRLASGPAHLDSPLPGRVIDVRVSAEQTVAEGDELVVVEAMKMEHAIKAPSAGIVRAVLCATGDQVERGQALVDFEPA